ncbi:MAG: EAL domain-containing protein [Magnetococcales bacterium]|nr:EAL domain-containing protein [Magnetococcales bacterium]
MKSTHNTILRDIENMDGLDPDFFSQLEEGVQIWDQSGNLLYANPATQNHFGEVDDNSSISTATFVSRCHDENRTIFLNNQFPVSAVIKTGKPSGHTVVQVTLNKPIWLRLSAYPISFNNGKEPLVLSISHDISSILEKSRLLEQRAHFDNLTGLPNRSVLTDRLTQALAYSKRRKEVLAVCMMDLDGFKPVNDSLGHEAGDHLLIEIARRLLKTLRSEDSAIRLGGDEFVLLIGGMKTESEGDLILKRVLDTIAQPFSIENQVVQVTASIGVTFFPNDLAIDEQLLRHADQAMYQAKTQGKNDYHIFNPTLESRHRANRNTMNRIAKALLAGQFELYFQPQVDCLRGVVHGVEALIRWHHPVLGTRTPAEFLTLIEQDDIIIDLGNWVIETAIKQLQSWEEEGLDLMIGINISARQLLRGNFEERLNQLFEKYPARLLKKLEIEILETAVLEDMKLIGELINIFKARGISFALDDFGTGFSTLSHLKHLSANTLKIDQSFIREMLSDPGDLAIVQGIIGLSEAFQCRVVAEGVQGIDQILSLLGMGCEVMQGYGIARPMPASKLPQWIYDFHKNPLWLTAQEQYPSRQSFNLLLMEVTHRYWFEKVMKHYMRRSNVSLEQPPHGYDNDRITKWYRGEGAQVFGELPEFHELDLLHQNVHYLGAELITKNADEKDSSTAELDRFKAASEKLVAAIQRFRNMIVVNKGFSQ